MKNLVFDSDGLIKLTKAGILEKVIGHFICSITKEVYDETVVKGLERFYDDAFQIDGLIISDDRAFLSVLQQNNVAFITPADFIVRSFELRILSKDESLNALDMIEPYICNYEKAKSDMEV